MDSPVHVTPSQPQGQSRPLRGLYLALIAFIVLAYLIAVVQQGLETKQEAETRPLYI
jgi:hypothetical protein